MLTLLPFLVIFFIQRERLASEVTTLWRYTNMLIIIIIILLLFDLV